MLTDCESLTEEQNPTRCLLLIYYAYVRLNMFRAPLCPSSGAHDDSVGYHIGRLVLELLLVGKLSAGRMDECPDGCCWLESYVLAGWMSVRIGHSSILPALNSQPAATQEPDGLCGNQRYRRELLMMGIMVPEKC